MFLLDFVKLVIYRVLNDWNLHEGTSLFTRMRTPLGPFAGLHSVQRK